jgi:pyruvate/2-oxoglutarate dehydrogenase complex dihydrolipoamide dehydrogenase (E3) component
VLDTLDLDAGGIAHARGRLVLDNRLRTSAKNVWAAGDVTSAPRFTHVADYQARTVIRNALFPLSTNVNYDVVPRVTYTIPELARVGLTEADAHARHGNGVRVWRRALDELDRAIADGQTVGMIKIVSDAKGHILGAHILGNHASSMIAEITLAMREKIALSRIASILHAYPTYAELVKQTADAYMKSRFTGAAKRAANFLVRR